VSHLIGWLALIPLAIAVFVFWFLLRAQERYVVEYVDVRGRRRRMTL
jgi:uncharacterized membrane protein